MRAAEIRALVLANARFWGSVAPLARAELSRWRELAGEIGDRELRELALAKLAAEAFNAEVAATLATLAPGRRRAPVVKAIVALEVLFDYLDGRTEALFYASRSEALRESRRLLQSLQALVSGESPELAAADSAYVDALVRSAHEHASALPGFAAVKPALLDAAARCEEAQLHLHAGVAMGDEQLRVWARQACVGSGLDWREYVGGCASSVLAMHALIAAAARANVSAAQARELDATYLAIGAVITTLDSLVDDARDRGAGEASYIRLYDGRREIQERLLGAIDEALARSGRARDGAHHAMTLAGAAAYYTTHPGAADPQNRATSAAVRRRLAPTIWPALAVLGGWRAAKSLRGSLAAARHGAGAARGVGAGERQAGDG